MKRTKIILAVMFMPFFLYAADLSVKIMNSSYIYNAESGTYWDETRTTLTYLENLFQPSLVYDTGEAVFEIGAGLLLPFDQEGKIIQWYPVIRTTLIFGQVRLTLGSLEGNHNFPTPVLDPLVNLTPQIRVISTNRVPLPYEVFPQGLFSHGYYEYGLSLQWESRWKGELYINWQLPDTENHRERFDMGLIENLQTWYLPVYTSLHYWHNGGHENPHVVSITENYNLALGLDNKTYSLLYLLSYWLPDRDAHPELNEFGQAVYARYQGTIGRKQRWSLEGELFLSSELINSNQRYVAIEGDPFYRMPLYLGLNISYEWQISPEFMIHMGFKNGVFWPGPGHSWDPLMIRYDQSIRIDLSTGFSLMKEKKQQESPLSAFLTEE